MGSRSSTSSTNTTQDFTTNNVDNRVAQGDGLIGGNINLNAHDSTVGNVNITTTDLGALDAASKLAERSLGTSEVLIDSALDVAAKAAEDDSSETLKYLVIGLTVVGVAIAVFVMKKP